MTTPATTHQLPGHVKVRLTYQTQSLVSEAALTLEQLGAKGPHIEEIWILLPAEEAYTTLEAYNTPLQTLKDAKVVPEDAKLIGFAIQSPLLDLNVLAYVLPTVKTI